MIDLSNQKLALFSAFAAGLLSVFSPCVYPLIPITISIMGAKTKNHLYNFLLSFTYFLSMSLFFSFLGFIFAFSGGLVSSFFQNKIFIFFIAVLFLFLSLSAFNVFYISLPSKINEKILKLKAHGIKGAFFMGLFSGLLALPCTGPVLGFILTLIAQKKDVFFAMLLMLSYSFGFCLIFMLLSFFSMQILPKSGFWLNFSKYIIGTLILITSLYYFSLLFKKEQVYHQDLNWNLISYNNTQKDLEDLLTKANMENKPTLIDFYASWCTLCNKLESSTFSDPKVKHILKNYFLIKIDLTKSTDELAKIQTRYNITGIPVILLIHKINNSTKEERIFGYLSALEFLRILKKYP